MTGASGPGRVQKTDASIAQRITAAVPGGKKITTPSSGESWARDRVLPANDHPPSHKKASKIAVAEVEAINKVANKDSSVVINVKAQPCAQLCGLPGPLPADTVCPMWLARPAAR